MRVLLIESNTVESMALQRELQGRYEIKAAASLHEALGVFAQTAWRPDVIVTSLDLPDAHGAGTLEALQATAAGIPIVVSTGAVKEALHRQLDTLGASIQEKNQGFSLLRAILQQQQLVQQMIAAHRSEIMAEIDHVARQAADTAIQQLIDKLDLNDDEGIRMAIRLARGWDAAKARFLSTIAAGIGSAFLLALGAGVVAVLRQGGGK